MMIRRILLTTTALASMSGLALAADMPLRAPLPAFTWTGFYIGGTVGAVSLSTKYSDPNGIDSQTNLGGGAVVGGTLGYNYQMGNIVLGLEGDWSYAGAQTSFWDGYYYYRGNTQLTSLGTARVRLGFTPWDRTLLYATGGFAWGTVKGNLGYDEPLANCATGFSGTSSGWTIGGGIEQAITDHITVKAEALYVDLGTKHGCDQYYGCRTSFKNTAVVGRVGLNFKF
jgi:outer membrane immunogenic protein